MSGVSEEVLEMTNGISKPCDNCEQVKRCKLYHTVEHGDETVIRIEYLCKSCAQNLDYI